MKGALGQQGQDGALLTESSADQGIDQYEKAELGQIGAQAQTRPGA